jgi:hypothetical protein
MPRSSIVTLVDPHSETSSTGATIGTVVDTPGSSDCEARSLEWAQPVLFATSWAYVVVGLALLWWVWRRNDIARGWGIAFAVAMILTGLGSVDYHGPVVSPQPFTHDGGLALALLVALGIDVLRISRDSRFALRRVGLLAVIAVVVLVWLPGLSPVLAGVVAVLLVVAEYLVYRRGLRVINWTQLAAVGSLALGVVVFALSRTGGPLCDPQSWAQGHGLWHLLTAAALGLWALGALPGSKTDIGLPTAMPAATGTGTGQQR